MDYDLTKEKNNKNKTNIYIVASNHENLSLCCHR